MSIFGGIKQNILRAMPSNGINENMTSLIQPPSGYTPDPAMSGMADYLKQQRQGDMSQGLDFASKYFGAGNPDMKEILDTRRQRALGLNAQEIADYRNRGMQGINETMSTGLRQLQGAQAANHIKGAAAVGQMMPVIRNANMARGNLERDIDLADMERRGQELSNYEKSVTGEREGTLGTALGFAGLGAGDRSNAMQYTLGDKFLDYAKNALANSPDPNFDNEGYGNGPFPESTGAGHNANYLYNMFGNIPKVFQGMGNSANYDPRNWDLKMNIGGGGGGSSIFGGGGGGSIFG